MHINVYSSETSGKERGQIAEFRRKIWWILGEKKPYDERLKEQGMCSHMNILKKTMIFIYKYIKKWEKEDRCTI